MATLRADHVGSFLRPPELLDARHRYAQGLLSNDQLTEIEDASILKILEVQQDASLEVFSDGEYRRGIYSGGNPLSWDDQRRKLDLLVSTAKKVWG